MAAGSVRRWSESLGGGGGFHSFAIFLLREERPAQRLGSEDTERRDA
jgi:hypothetical protein